MLPIHRNEKIMVDPPSGWLYGFPKEWTGDTKKMLRDSGYPKKEIPWALQNCRFWTKDV